MKPTKFNKIVSSAAAAVVVTLLSAACVAQNRDSAQVAQLLMEAKGHAVQAATDAAHLETYHMAGIPWQVHYFRLVQTGDDLKALTKDLKQLRRLRDEASPTQQKVIDKFATLLGGLNLRVSATRKYLVQNSAAVNMPIFHEQIRSNYADIERVSAALCNCVKSENNRILAANAGFPKVPHPGKSAGPDCPAGEATMPR